MVLEHLRDALGGVADQDFHAGRGIVEHAGEGPNPGAADQAAFQGEDRRSSQPTRILDGDLDVDVGLGVVAQFDPANPADGEAGKVRSIPTATPSEFSATRTRAWVGSKTPRADMTKKAKAASKTRVAPMRTRALALAWGMSGGVSEGFMERSRPSADAQCKRGAPTITRKKQEARHGP